MSSTKVHPVSVNDAADTTASFDPRSIAQAIARLSPQEEQQLALKIQNDPAATKVWHNITQIMGHTNTSNNQDNNHSQDQLPFALREFQVLKDQNNVKAIVDKSEFQQARMQTPALLPTLLPP